MIVVIDEVCNCTLQITGQILVFEEYPALQREMPALDLALRHRMIRLAARVFHVVLAEPVLQIACDVGWAIV